MASLLFVGLVTLAAAITWTQAPGENDVARSLRDSLLLVARGAERGGSAYFVTGSIEDDGVTTLPSVFRDATLPDWARSLQLPWIRPSMSRSGTVVAELMTETGTDVYLLRGPDVDPVPLVVGPGTDAVLGWSPDGEAILVRRSRTLANGSFDADLWSFRLGEGVLARAIDTSGSHSVQDEARWSPDGSRIAWVAQTGPAHQRDVFVARADGSGAVNVTDMPAEDFHISWSSDGNLLAFTSDRDGNHDLFAIDFADPARRLWRLTRSPADEDFASFSPDRRFVAFESTVAGDAAVYVMPALGGQARRVTPPGGQFSILGWRGKPTEGYLDRFRIIGPSTAGVGDTVRLSIIAADADGNRGHPNTMSMALLDSSSAELRRPADSTSGYFLIGRRNGTARVVASIPGWREDTLVVTIGSATAVSLSDDFSRGVASDRWIALGTPRPTARTANGMTALYPNADLQWQSGVLSQGVVALTDSIDIAATFSAPFDRPVAGALLVLALVDPNSPVDSVAPDPGMLVSVQWDGEASRFTYAVGSQSKSDPASTIEVSPTHRVRVVLSPRGEVHFFVDGRARWSSSLRLLGTDAQREARIWLGGKATSTWGSIRDFVVSRR